jgi:hypothetical protein
MSHTVEYLALKEFLHSFTDRFGHSRSKKPANPPLSIVEAAERTEPSRAAASLRMVVNDCMELSAHWPFEQVVALDAALHAMGILSLSQVRRRAFGGGTQLS